MIEENEPYLDQREPDDRKLINREDWFKRLHQIKDDYARLKDWSDLLVQLNEILFTFGAFFREIERLFMFHEEPEPSTVGLHWSPISQRVVMLLKWASLPRNIDEVESFARHEDRIVGPKWAVELSIASNRLDELLQPDGSTRLFGLPRDLQLSRQPYVDINDLCDAASEFYDVAERARYLTERKLCESITEFGNRTQIMLANLEEN
jgi:hypothetical protein